MAVQPTDAPKEWRGRFFEDFEVGDVYRSRLGRTITQTDNIWFTLLTLNTNQVHFNEVFAARTRFGRPLVNSTLTLALITGMSVPDTSENATANLAWTDIICPTRSSRATRSGPRPRCSTSASRARARPSHRRRAHPRHQPAPRGRDRVPAHVHGLPPRRSEVTGGFPGTDAPWTESGSAERHLGASPHPHERS